jgi:hypothetical protein
MNSRLLRRLGAQVRTQWAGLLTIFLLLTAGTAYALPGSNTVLSGDIVNGEVTSADVADESLTGRDARQLSASDIEKGSFGTSQVAESSFGTVPLASQAGAGRTLSKWCSESSSYVDCGSLPVDLARSGRILVIASVDTGGNDYADDVRGPCRLEVDGAPIATSETYFKYDAEGARTPFGYAPEGAGQSATLTAVTDAYPPGRKVIGVECALVASGEALNGDDGDASASTDISVFTLSDR